MTHHHIEVRTRGEALYSVTESVTAGLKMLLQEKYQPLASGILHLFVMHTSCALTVSEDYDPLARHDLEAFLKHLVPRDLPFIRHTLEGPDDSPSHMKSALLHQNLAFIVENGKLLLGRWQGIFLAEFRDHSHDRSILLKFTSD